MPHQGNTPADIIAYDGQGRPIYKGHSNNVRANNNLVNNRVRNSVTNNNTMMRNNNRAANQNPVTRLFNAPQSPRYFKPNGSMVPVGAPLHQHQDGTIMTEHGMGPNDNSVVVTTSSPRGNNVRTRASRNTRTTRTRGRMTRGMSGNGRSYGASSGQ